MKSYYADTPERSLVSYPGRHISYHARDDRGERKEIWGVTDDREERKEVWGVTDDIEEEKEVWSVRDYREENKKAQDVGGQ